MADNRKYYYLKLKENFFDSDSVVLLEDMKDGILYSNILLKLYLKSLKNGGRLQLDEHIPYTAQMIATLTRHQIGTVERALAIFQQLGIRSFPNCKRSCPKNGRTTLIGFPAISRPRARNIKTTPPLSADGRQTIPQRLPRNRAYPNTPARRARAYE